MTNPIVMIIRKGISGYGVFADKKIKKGERLFKSVTYDIHSYWGLQEHGLTKYINHGYNCIFVDVDKEAWIEAVKDISVGEEILVDYRSIDKTFPGLAYYIRYRRSLGDMSTMFEKYPKLFRLMEMFRRKPRL